jgi:single-strand DNA-binding protein
VVWRRLAEIVGEFVSKGSHVYIEGKLQTTTWEDRQSAGKKYRTEIVADDLVLLGSREKGSGVQPTRSDPGKKHKANHAGSAGVAELDSDVPF